MDVRIYKCLLISYACQLVLVHTPLLVLTILFLTPTGTVKVYIHVVHNNYIPPSIQVCMYDVTNNIHMYMIVHCLA